MENTKKVKYPKISIIIPLYVISPRFFKDLKKFKKLDYPNYEIVVVCDKEVEIKDPKIKFILTGQKQTGPAEKRDIAIKQVKSEICAFIDDDAYPDKDWLKNAVVHFNHPQIAAVGGPGVTPSEDNYWEQITGLVYSSFYCGGHARHRFTKEKSRLVEDYPAYNLLIRRNVLLKVGGYGNHFYGGEDTFLCLKIIKKGYRIFYDPEVLVFHHRRALFVPYLKQIANIGKHRGYFAKKFPETSRSLSYFIPSILTIGFFLGLILSVFIFSVRILYFGTLGLFICLGALSVIKNTNIINALIVSIGIIFTHLTYGFFFVKGLLTKRLIR